MATVNKNFKVKHGLVVEGTTGTINGEDILTKAQADIDYIIDQVGGSGESTNTPNTLVLRDANGDFAAGTITADLTGQVSDISNHDTDDLSEGATNKYYSTTQAKADAAALLTGATKTNISITGDENGLTITAENGVADSTTDDLDEGATNLYFTNQRALDATAAAYDAAGAAGDVAADLSTHEGLTSGVHGVTGDVVGTTDDQDLSNKRIVDTLYFTDGVTISDEAEIAVRAVSHDFDVQANQGDLHLKTVAAESDVQITSTYGDILLNADGAAYYGSASAENEIATHGYVDNAISGLTWKQSVNLLYDAAIPVLSGSGATQLIVDGHDVLGDADSGYRLLLTGATSPGIYVYNSTRGSWTLTRSEDADVFGELIGAAVYVMEGTQYGSTSWVQGNHYLTDFTGQTWTQFSGSGSVTAGEGITVDGLEIAVDRTTVDTWYDAAGAAAQALSDAEDYADGLATNYDVAGAAAQALSDAEDYADGLATNYDVAGAAAAAQTAAESYADGLAVNYDAAGSAATAETNANGYTDTEIGNLDTDDIEEGSTNQYYTTTRAKADAADLLTGATLENITITGDENGLTITAENGVADSDTDDLTEGSSNLYFTDQRAVDALEAVTPNFVEIDINSIATQIAATVEVPTASTVTAHAFPKADYRSAEYLVKVAYGTHTEISKVLLTLDTSDNIAITEYAIVGTNGSASTISADVSGTDVRLRVATANNGSDVTVVGTLVA
jgi:HSP20 family molecular chaperone IbpA